MYMGGQVERGGDLEDSTTVMALLAAFAAYAASAANERRGQN